MFENLESTVFTPELPLFIASNLVWGLVFLVLSIIFSILTWRAIKRAGVKAFLIWLFNLIIFILGLVMITKAFPRFSPSVVFSVIFVIVLGVISGGTVAVKKEGGKQGEKDTSSGSK